MRLQHSRCEHFAVNYYNRMCPIDQHYWDEYQVVTVNCSNCPLKDELQPYNLARHKLNLILNQLDQIK